MPRYVVKQCELARGNGDKLEPMEDAQRHHVHVIYGEKQEEALHEYLDDCACEPVIEMEENEDGDTVVYFFHNAIH